MPYQCADEDLARLAQRGDREAFSALYGLYVDKVFRRVQSRVPPPYVEDVTQEVFVAVIRSLDAYEYRSSFNTWLYTIVNRQIADFYRRHHREQPGTPLDAGLDDATLPELVYGAETMEERPFLQVAFARLPDHYQEVILLRFADGLTFDEIAARRAQSLEAVKSLYRRAIQALRELMHETSRT